MLAYSEAMVKVQISMKVISVVGARPQFVKLAPIDRALKLGGHEHIIVHTGQHYDPEMSENFFTDLGISKPDINLDVGSGSHAKQTASMMPGLEEVFLSQKADWVLVYGDTNSTLAAALVAVKIHQKVAHLEAGLRSFNRRMPEEHNRVLTDHSSDMLLAPTEEAMRHLADENLSMRAVLVGDVMVDVCLDTYAKASSGVLSDLGLQADEYYVATIHRPDNTDNPGRLTEILTFLDNLESKVILAAHPRLRAKLIEFKIDLDFKKIQLVTPLGYPDLVTVLANAKAAITDSGGLQKEAFLLRTPCVTLRTETEWVETVELGVNLVNNSPSVQEAQKFISEVNGKEWPQDTPYGAGDAALKVVQALERSLVPNELLRQS
jgi:UDP-N-acetylglucosamine 2-epimerase (non-hydrolysing)